MDHLSAPPTAPPQTPRYVLLPRLALALLAGLALLGCNRDEEIRHYRAARVETPPTRLLVAMIPAGDKVWFFKLTGPAPEVAEHQAEFEQLVRSAQFPDKGEPPVTWTVPAGWQQKTSSERLRYATFRVGKTGLELIVTHLGREAGEVLPNVNRWRGQLGLGPITEGELAPLKHEFQANGHTVTLIDMAAKPDESAAPPPSLPPMMASRPAAAGALGYDTPPGWEKIPATGMRVAAFKINDGSRSAEVTVIPLSGQAGGLRDNVNRWRQQIGLGPITDEQLRKEAKPIQSADASGFTVDLLGPESAGDKRQRTLGAILLHGGQSWFIKLQGPFDLVGKQQDAFEKFVRSIRFGAGEGAKP